MGDFDDRAQRPACRRRRRPVGSAASEPGPRGLQNELRLQHNSLRTLAEETGGFAVINTNSFENTFNRIVEENSSYYVLAYYPPNPKRDGKFHNIRVRVNRPGLTVRARRGYANPSGKAPVPAANSREPAERRDEGGARQPVARQRPDDAGVCRAVQGHGAEGVRVARRGDIREEPAARRRRQAAAFVLRDGREGQVSGREHRHGDAQPSSGDQD